MSSDCPVCKSESVRLLTRDEFRKRFKVGDLIVGYKGGIKAQITAIGESRFLYKRTDRADRGEAVGTMDSYASQWRGLK